MRFIHAPFRRIRPRTGGFLLISTLIVLFLVSAVAGFYLFSARQQAASVRRWHESDQTLLDAQSGLERVKYELTQSFFSNYNAGGSAGAWLSTWTSNTIGANPVYVLPSAMTVQQSVVSVTITGVALGTLAINPSADISLVSRARRGGDRPLVRIVRETLNLTGESAAGLDYAYVLDRRATLANAGLTINGGVRVNGDLTLGRALLLNGTAYAAGLVNGAPTRWGHATYLAQAPLRARPGDPTARATGAGRWPMGYTDKTPVSVARLPPLTLPRTGPLAACSNEANASNGRLGQGAITRVNKVYAGPGPDGAAGTPDDGTLILDGSSQALSLSGTVLVTGDLILKGKITGKGCIYAGRNIHLVGDVVYVNPPSWPKPDRTPTNTAQANLGRDLLVLAARGNIVVGDYTAAEWSNRVWGLMTSPAAIFPYAVDADEASLGYDTDNQPGNGFLFDGRYAVPEPNGGRRLDAAGTAPRRFFESSLAPATFRGACDPAVNQVDAALVSNHAIIGNWGASGGGKKGEAVLNGALVARDDYNAFYNLLLINWDIRLGYASPDRIALPITVPVSVGAAIPYTLNWREIH